MRIRARLVLGLYGVALAVPGVVMAGPLGDDEAMGMAPPQMQAARLISIRGCLAVGTASSVSAPTIKAHDGVDIPAPPPLDSGMQGQVISNGAHCPTCQGNVVVSGPVMSHNAHDPGYRRRWRHRTRPATRSSVKPWSAPSRRPSVSPRPGITARWTRAWPRWVLALVRRRSIRRLFLPICRPPRLRCRHRHRTDRTSSATFSGCRASAGCTGNSRTRNGKSTPRSPTARLTRRSARFPPRWYTAEH